MGAFYSIVGPYPGITYVVGQEGWMRPIVTDLSCQLTSLIRSTDDMVATLIFLTVTRSLRRCTGPFDIGVAYIAGLYLDCECKAES